MAAERFHAPEMLAAAVLLPHGHYVVLDDMLFKRHGLGQRYAQVHSVRVDNRPLSYAYLDLEGTTYDLITSHYNPRELGTFDDLVGADGLYCALDMAFTANNRSRNFATQQQMALALIRARAIGAQPSDELAMRRIARWAKCYERRAWWITKHLLQAYSSETIDWERLGL